MSNDEPLPLFTLNGMRVKFYVNNGQFPTDVDLEVDKESMDRNSVAFNISVKPKTTDKKDKRVEKDEEDEKDEIPKEPAVESPLTVQTNHVESSKSRVSFREQPFLLTDNRMFSSSTISATDSNFSEVSGLTNIFKKDSNTLISLKKNTADSKMKLSRPNVFVSQSPNQSKMKTEKVRSITKINRAMPRNENEIQRIQPIDGPTTRFDDELNYVRNNLIQVLHRMEYIQSKLEALLKTTQ